MHNSNFQRMLYVNPFLRGWAGEKWFVSVSLCCGRFVILCLATDTRGACYLDWCMVLFYYGRGMADCKNKAKKNGRREWECIVQTYS